MGWTGRFSAMVMAGWSVALCGLAAASEAPLADAVERNDVPAVRRLLDDGADVDAVQVDGMTALHWAVYHGDVALSQKLVESGADVNAETRYQVTPLSVACINGDKEIVELLLAAGADPNTTLPGGETALMTAARTGRIGPVRALLARGADVNARERKGQTALMWAAAEGHGEVVDALIDAGADFRTSLKSGFTPFFFAVREGRADVVSRLLARGVGVNDVMQGDLRGTRPLILAVENGHFQLAASLLDAGADPNDRTRGYTALHALTWVRKPIRGDGDPPPIGSGNLSSLDLARKLVGHGADVNARHGRYRAVDGRLNRTDATPFLLAAETGDLPLMKLLLELGADPHLQNADHCTPLLAAAGVGVLGNGEEAAGSEQEAIAAIQLLLDLGAEINAIDDNGETAMHGAAYKSWPKLVQFLADHDADVRIWNQKNRRGWTPLLIAQGHRPGNFRPSPETITAVQHVMHSAGADPLTTSASPGAQTAN